MSHSLSGFPPPPGDCAIHFHAEDVPMPLGAADQGKITAWIEHIIKAEGKSYSGLTYIFCSDEYLHRINLRYLNHDTYTDIITFPLSENPIESDIFISTERVRENALEFDTDFMAELHRVMIHGVLHLCGYPDKTEVDAKVMRGKENWALEALGRGQTKIE